MIKDDVISMAADAKLYSGKPRTPGTGRMLEQRLESFAAAIEQKARTQEREECARFVETCADLSQLDPAMAAYTAKLLTSLATALRANKPT